MQHSVWVQVDSPDQKSCVAFELTSTEKLDSSLALWLLTTKNIYFHRQILTQLRLDNLGIANLPAPMYRGGQVAGRLPSSFAPQWTISTFLTGQMSDTWQDCHPYSPAGCLQTGYFSSPEIKAFSLFLSLLQTFSPSCLFSLGWLHF